jgi:Cytochrome P450
MRDSAAAPSFEKEPLAFLDGLIPTVGDAFWLPGRQLCVAEVQAARAVLANRERLYEESSDFYRTARGTLGPRVAQVEIARLARRVLRNHLELGRERLEAAVKDELSADSHWPDAGNWLVHRHLRAALVDPGRSPQVAALVDEVVGRAVLAGVRERQSRLRRLLFRFRVHRELARAIEERRRAGGQAAPEVPAPDVLGAVALGAGAEVPAALLAEVFLSFVFAVSGSAGFALGWSVYLLGTHPATRAERTWVVQEALRLWPVAWLFARRPACDHEVAGVRVTPRDEVLVCPYVVQRLPRYWSEPTRFRPERWAETRERPAFLPFGWGPHSCAGAALTLELTSDILHLLGDGSSWAVEPHSQLPHVGPALAPPRFTLRPTEVRR